MECVDDLRWAIEGPFLWSSPPPLYNRLLSASDGLWRHLADDPGEFLELCAPHRRTPIGRYFEKLYGYWLSNLADVENVHQNLTIQGPEGTLGELDLAFQTLGASYHWELALKFYVGVGDLTNPASWHGPRGKDRLDKKIEKLLQRQLCLPEKSQVRERLESLGMSNTTSHAVVKGYLFYPWEDWSINDSCPKGVHPGHDRGWWLPFAQLQEILDMPAAGWKILSKADWLGPYVGAGTMKANDVRGPLAEQIVRFGSTMLAAIDDHGREQSRGFVVPDDWAPLK